MKYLFLILFSFNSFALSLPEIASLTWQQTFPTLSERLAPGCVYSFDNDALTDYEKWVLLEGQAGCVKPTIPELNAELVVYKAELTAIEQERLDKIARQDAIRARFDALDDLRFAMTKCLYTDANMELFKKDVIENEIEVKIACLESKDPEVISERIARETEKANRSAAVTSLKAAAGVRVLTPEEIRQAIELLLKGL